LASGVRIGKEQNYHQQPTGCPYPLPHSVNEDER
jgi:hypothetical protein